MGEKYSLENKLKILESLSKFLMYKLDDDIKKVINEKMISIIKTL